MQTNQVSEKKNRHVTIKSIEEENEQKAINRRVIREAQKIKSKVSNPKFKVGAYNTI